MNFDLGAAGQRNPQGKLVVFEFASSWEGITLCSDEKVVELESLLAFFARFELDTELVSQIMRWDIVVLKESPWYQEILSEEEMKGRQEEGRSLIIRQLMHRFGSVAPAAEAQIQTLSIAQLEVLGEAFWDFASAEDLDNWLQSLS